MRSLRQVSCALVGQFILVVSALLAGCASSAPAPQTAIMPVVPIDTPTRPTAPASQVLLGIDVLEQQDFRALLGKRVGLLSHPAGVNRFGMPTLDVIRRDKRINLVALFGVEHGIHGEIPAGEKYEDHRDEETGLPVYSLYSGRTRYATPEQLRSIDVLVIDLQDIGTRSYTFSSAMLYQLEACFQNNVEVVVLDRPNPLGGIKVSGPINDAEWVNYLGAFRVPYVHGMTMGELARMAVSEPGVMKVPESVRKQGRLTVIPMRGWTRAMTWKDTGLRWVATSPYVKTLDAVEGYPMTGLGAQLGGFQHGIGTPHPFRLLSHPAISRDRLLAELQRRNLRGLRFVSRDVSLPPLRNGRDGAPRQIEGVFVEIVDWNAWQPTELSWHMMQMAAQASAPRNPFADASADASSLFNKHAGSTRLWNALKREGPRFDPRAFTAESETQARDFRERSRRFWLYQ